MTQKLQQFLKRLLYFLLTKQRRITKLKTQNLLL